jgi:hypothetical protein
MWVTDVDTAWGGTRIVWPRCERYLVAVLRPHTSSALDAGAATIRPLPHMRTPTADPPLNWRSAAVRRRTPRLPTLPRLHNHQRYRSVPLLFRPAHAAPRNRQQREVPPCPQQHSRPSSMTSSNAPCTWMRPQPTRSPRCAGPDATLCSNGLGANTWARCRGALVPSRCSPRSRR